MPEPRTILVEGWRFVPHSYAIVNQFQLLELLKRPDLRVYHRDAPPHKPLTPVGGLFDASSEAAIKAIPEIPAAATDAVYRISFPYNVAPADVPRLCVFGTSEMRNVASDSIIGAGSLAEAQARSENLVIVTPSNWSQQGFLDSGSDPERTLVVPHGVDPAIFRPGTPDEREKHRRLWKLDGFVFLTVGAVTWNKGIPLLLKAFARVASRHPRSVLLIKGLDSLYRSKQQLDEHAKQLTESEAALVHPRLRYVGMTCGFADLARIYQLADAYVTPYHAEGFNLPALEAAACGLPVICTAGGPTDDFTTPDFALRIPSTMRPLREGAPDQVLVPDSAALVDQMISIVERDDFRARARVAGPAHVGGHFTWKRAADQLVKIMFE